jgi:hypothetical protein
MSARTLAEVQAELQRRIRDAESLAADHAKHNDARRQALWEHVAGELFSFSEVLASVEPAVPVSRDAQRWAAFRSRAHITMGEDGDLWLGLRVGDEGIEDPDWRERVPWLTPAWRREVRGEAPDTMGVLSDPAAIDAAVDDFIAAAERPAPDGRTTAGD